MMHSDRRKSQTMQLMPHFPLFRSGESRVVLPAPVIRKRACGAWSGCGRRLAVSSGGEIRVYSDPSEENPPSTVTVAASGVLDQQPVRTGTVRGSFDPTLPLATEVPGGWLSADQETQPGGQWRATGADNTFCTALCVEASMYEGGILSSPGSSPGGTPSSLSPSARQVKSPPSPRLGVARGSPGGRGLVVTASSAPRTRTESGPLADGEGCEQPSSRATSASLLSASVISPPPPLVGNMRAMCPAGPLAFFGTTDGGLGLDSVIAATGTTGTSGHISAIASSGVTKRRGNELLGAIVSTSTAARTATLGAGDAGGIEKCARRRGFRHVLPGDNWLAGSLRPSSRSGSPSRQRGSNSPESPRDMSDPVSLQPTGCVPVVPSGGRETAGAVAAVAESVVGASQPMAASEILDLRGKLGEGASGVDDLIGRARGASSTSTHPLFKVSLPGEVGTMSPSVIGSSSDGIAFDTGIAAAASVRKPWLVRVSCRSRSSGGTAVAGSSGSDGVGVKSLASLPPGLASPDLLASSEDGRYVAVGSHACDLVACFRLELGSSDERSMAADKDQDAKSSSDPVAEASLLSSTNGDPLASCGSGGRGGAKIDKGGVRRRKRRHRRAVPLCTLRLPPGYRAKGLTVVKEKLMPTGHCGTSGSAARTSSVSGTGGEPALSDNSVAEGVVVIVLGGCAVPDPHAATSDARRSNTGSSLYPAEPDRRGSSSSSSEEASYRTVLLRYLLPSAPSETAGSGVVRGRKIPSDNDHSTSTIAGGSKHARPAIAPTGCGEQVGSGASSTSAGCRARGSTSASPQSFDENDTGPGDGTRLEAVILGAVAGAEQRMGARFDRIERMLVGVCDRLGVLEDTVKGQGQAETK